MVFEVGYPTEWPEWCKMEGLREDSFFANYQKTESCRADKHRKKLYEPVKRREWQYAGSTDVNAYYSQKVNGLFIPAAVLDKPFFSPAYDSARNYGSIGAVLGHEMTHGFDDQGRKFDKTGMRAEWWDAKTVDGFTQEAECISDQYGGYTIHGDKKVSGKLTLGEVSFPSLPPPSISPSLPLFRTPTRLGATCLIPHARRQIPPSLSHHRSPLSPCLSAGPANPLMSLLTCQRRYCVSAHMSMTETTD